jgi:hypothetical protein
VCRCGAERSRLEALGYNVEPVVPSLARKPAKAVSEAEPGLAGTLLGYRSQAHIWLAWRVVFLVVFVAMVAGAGYGVVRFTHTPLQPTRENVVIVSTLEDHTRNAEGVRGNTIPEFLALPGTVGLVEPTMTASDLLKSVSEEDLSKGFCSPKLARQIRYEFPGFYESWPDDKLERVVLEKYPEFQDRMCILPSQLGISPDDVVKYQIRPRTVVETALLWSRTAIVTILVAAALLNVYYRLIVSAMPESSG